MLTNKTSRTVNQTSTKEIEALVLAKKFNEIKEFYDSVEKFDWEVKFSDPDGDLATLVVNGNTAEYIRRTNRNDKDGISDGYLGKRLTLNNDLTVDIKDI